MELIETAKRIVEIDESIKKETFVTPTFNDKDSFSPNVKATVAKTLNDLKKPEIKYDLPVETPYTNIHTQFDFIVKGSNSQFRMFEIPTTETQFDISDNYITYLNTANMFMTREGKPKIDDTLLTPFVMKNIKIINKNVDEVISGLVSPDSTNYSESLKILYKSLVELVVEENKKAEEEEAKIKAAALAAAAVGQKGGGFNVDEVLKFETLMDITPEKIEEDMYISSLFFTLFNSPFPKIVDSANILSENITNLTQQLLDIDECYQTLLIINKKLPTSNISKCFKVEVSVIDENLKTLVKALDIEKISDAYVRALSYLKTKKELQDISSTMITRDKEQEERIIREEIVKKATEALDGIFLIEVDTFDTPFVGPNSRNIKIVIPAKEYNSHWYNAISNGASYTDLSLLPYKKFKKSIACDFYKDNKIKDIYVTYYDTTFISFKLKEVKPINGEIYLEGDDNKLYDIKKCYFTTTDIKESFKISLDHQYMVGFFFGNIKGDEKYLPGYYVKEKCFFLKDPTDIRDCKLEFRDRNKELATLIDCELSYETDQKGVVEVVESLDNVITNIIFKNSIKKKIEDVFVTGVQLQKIYTEFGLETGVNLAFLRSDVSTIIKKPALYRNFTVYLPGVNNVKKTSVPLYNTKQYPKNSLNKTPLPIDHDLTSKDYKITYIEEDGGIEFKTGQLIRITKNVEKYIFTIRTDEAKEYDIDQCFFTKYQWEKILGNSYIDYEEFFIGWADPNNFSSITDKETPLYLPGYYFTNEKNEKICNFFMDTKSEVASNNYVSNFPAIILKNGNELSYDTSEEALTSVLTNDDGTIKEIKFASGDISIDRIFVQQHQILNFYPTLWNLSFFFKSTFAPQTFCERKITIYKILQTDGTKFSISLKKDMGFDISIFGNKKTITNIADDYGNLHQITKIFIEYDPSNDKSSFMFIDGTTNYDILDIYLYENEMNKLLNVQKNINGLIEFSLEKNTNLEGQNCDVITNSPNSFFPGYQLDNKFKLLCNSDVIPTVLTKSSVDNFIGKEISFLNLTGAEENRVIANYICNDKDEIIGVNVDSGSVINIERCFVKNTQIQEYYDDYNVTFEEYLNKYEILLCRVNNNQTSFISTRPIWIYTFFKRVKSGGDVKTFVPLNSLGHHGDEIVFINSDTDINSLNQDFQLYNNNTSTSTTTKLSSINYVFSTQTDSYILFNNNITLNNVFIYSYQLNNTYGTGFMNAEVNFKLFMINSETITEYQDIIDKYNVKNNELLFLYGYFHGNGAISNDDTIELLMDNPLATNATSKTINYTRDYDFFPVINTPDKVITVDNYIQNKDMMSEVVYTDGDRQQISIKKCFKIITYGIVINHTPLNLISSTNLFDFLTTDATIIQNILDLPINELSGLDNSIITVITEFITDAQLNALDNNKIILLYSKTDNQQDLTNKLSAIKAVEIFNEVDPTDQTKKRVAPTLQDIQNLKDNIIDNLDLLPADIKEKSDIIDGFTEAQIAHLIDPTNATKLNKLSNMNVDEINDNLEYMSPKYLKLLLKKIPTVPPVHMRNLINAIDKHLTIPQIEALTILPQNIYNIIAKKIINQESLDEKTILLKNISNRTQILREALDEITDKGEVVKLLNNEDIITKLSDNQVQRIVNTLRHNDILFLNNGVTTKLNKDVLIDATTLDASQMATIIDMINSDRLNDKLTRVDGAFKQNFANALLPDKIAKLPADKIQVLRNQVRDTKLIELFSNLDKAQLESLTPEQINKLLESSPDQFYNIFKTKGLTGKEIIKLNSPALITQLMADNTVVKQVLVDSLEDISDLDVASIEALEATLDSHQCLGIFDKIKSKLTPEKLNAFTRGLDPTPWHDEITKLDDDDVSALIRTMDAAEIERRNDDLDDDDKWLDIFEKIKDNEIINFDANQINAISKNGHWSGKDLINELVKPGVIDGMTPEKKLAIKTLLEDNQEKLKTLGDDNLRKLGFTTTNGLFSKTWKKGGIKTKRSKVKKNKTRRL